jgi:hypothetical protein
MFMDEGNLAQPPPRKSIIKDGMEVKKVMQVKEETQRSMLAQGAAEKVCYDANRYICIVRQGKAAFAARLFAADDECRSSSSFAIQPGGTPSC